MTTTTTIKCTSITWNGKLCKNDPKSGDTWCRKHIAVNSSMGVKRRVV